MGAFLTRKTAIAAFSLLLMAAAAASAKEYNKATGINPEQQAKISKVMAKSRIQKKRALDDIDDDTLLKTDDVTQTGCGNIAIGNIQQESRYGRRIDNIDRDIIITGDVINIANDCKAGYGKSP